MKKQILLTTILLAAMGVGGFQTSQVTTAHARAKKTMKVYPKRYRHSWYHYDGHGKYDKVRFTKKVWHYAQYYDGTTTKGTLTLHSRSVRADLDKAKIHGSWVVGQKFSFRHASWIDLRGWNQSAGDGTYYKVTTKKFHGKKVSVLTDAYGAMVTTDKHYYRSKKVAKRLGNHHFKGESYSV